MPLQRFVTVTVTGYRVVVKRLCNASAMLLQCLCRCVSVEVVVGLHGATAHGVARIALVSIVRVRVCR